MNSIGKEIFRAIHEGKWLTIEYKNKENKITKYWVGIKSININKKLLNVEGLHLTNFTLNELTIYINSIISAHIIDGSVFTVNKELVEDINEHPQKYSNVFSEITNLKILNYLSDCNKLDNCPYRCDYILLNNFDEDCVKDQSYKLSDEQFMSIVKEFQFSATQKNNLKIKQLCVNVLSINSQKGLYLLAYKKLNLDVVKRELVADSDVTICKEFTVDGEKQSIRLFLDADDCDLLDNFDENREVIKDKILAANINNKGQFVDDMPYLMAIEMNIIIDLKREYSAILEMFENDRVTKPIQAFFGNLLEHSANGKSYCVALLNKKVNLDQLLAINNAMKYPVVYIQGPPGTGKTNTIINIISTAFFNDKTVLFSSYNNHPIDSVYQYLSTLKYKNNVIPFPVVRLGNNNKVRETIEYIKNLYDRAQQITVYDRTLKKNKSKKVDRTRKLTALLKKYEEVLNLEERKETVEKLLSCSDDLTFISELQARQKREIEEKIKKIGSVTEEDAFALLTDDTDEYFKYLYYTSAKYIKKLGEDEFSDLREILYLSDEDARITEFNKYIANDENFSKFLKVFPIVITTCISAHRLGESKQYFDTVILDEASQCNTAISLVPIIRGENLILVGDPQQLNPVIVLDSKVNSVLRTKYSIGPEYDYINNSIYKTYLACDAVSDEILLRYHYRCHKKIIEFNNKKYYNDKLEIRSTISEEHPLIYVDVKDDITNLKNTAPEECNQIIKFVKDNPDKSIGVITPFVNQKNLINNQIKELGLTNVTCGTVHSFQGDEKDIILFSLALTNKTHKKTYDWLKGNKELINVAVSRAKNQLIMLVNNDTIEHLHEGSDDDDIFELVQYVKSNGTSRITSKMVKSRALGIKPYSTETEEAFLTSLNHALSNINIVHNQCEVKKEVAISQVFEENFSNTDLFYTGRFDFVVYDKKSRLPIFAIELDGMEHHTDESVKMRDEKKKKICDEHNFELIRVENSYARRYIYIKDILINYFSRV